MRDIASYDVMSTPCVVIDGKADGLTAVARPAGLANEKAPANRGGDGLAPRGHHTITAA